MEQTYVMRTWKRDRSVNLMTLDVAAANVAGNGQLVMNVVIPCRAEVIKAKLLAGKGVETKLARFRMVVS